MYIKNLQRILNFFLYIKKYSINTISTSNFFFRNFFNLIYCKPSNIFYFFFLVFFLFLI